MANPVKITTNAGNEEWIQKVIPIDETGTANSELLQEIIDNQNSRGNLFSIDSVVANLIPTVSENWSQGIPSQGFHSYIVGSAYWKIVSHDGALNGACECATGTNANGFFFGTTVRPNRYENGRLSFFLATWAFVGIEEANGDFEVLVGGMFHGLESEGKNDEIKEGIVFGFVRESGITRKVGRVYKNFNIEHEFEITSENFPTDYENLYIYTIKFGYLGIHPFQLYVADDTTNPNTTKEIFDYSFRQNVTTVNNPDLCFGVFVKNNGNTTNVGVRNGSFSFGNIGNERIKIDSSARFVEHNYISPITITSVVGGSIVATYRIPEKTTMIKEVNSGGVLTDTFLITKYNQLLEFSAIATSAKPVKVEIYFFPSADQTGATYTKLNANYNLLEVATGAALGTISKTNFQLLKSFLVAPGNNITSAITANVREFNFLLQPLTVAAIVVKNAQNVTDYEHTVFTLDLF